MVPLWAATDVRQRPLDCPGQLGRDCVIASCIMQERAGRRLATALGATLVVLEGAHFVSRECGAAVTHLLESAILGQERAAERRHLDPSRHLAPDLPSGALGRALSALSLRAQVPPASAGAGDADAAGAVRSRISVSDDLDPVCEAASPQLLEKAVEEAAALRKEWGSQQQGAAQTDAAVEHDSPAVPVSHTSVQDGKGCSMGHAQQSLAAVQRQCSK